MDVLITFASQWAIVGLAICGLSLAGQVRLHWRWLFVALSIFALEVAALMYAGPFLGLERVFGELDWNWGGKIAGVLASVIVLTALWLIVRKPPSAVGVTFRQTPGSLLPALVMTLVLIALSVCIELWAQDGTDIGTERLLYQATMPGLDEELFWRGVLLLSLTEALRGGRWDLLGAEINWAGVLTTVLFGLAHGMAYGDGGFSFSVFAVCVTGVMGFGLYWLRERTGSIIWPIFAHNLVNFANSFF